MELTIEQFCAALHRATLGGDRDSQGAEGEAIWALLEAIERKHGGGKVALEGSSEDLFAKLGQLAGVVELPLEEIMQGVDGVARRLAGFEAFTAEVRETADATT